MTNVPKSNQTIFNKRQNQLSLAMATAGLHSIILNPGPTMIYLTGISFHLMERPTILIFSPGDKLRWILPELEVGKLSGLSYDVETFSYNDDPSTWGETFEKAFQSTFYFNNKKPRIGIEPLRLRVMEQRYILGAIQHADLISAEDILGDLRICKDEEELKAEQKAAKIAEQALQATLPNLKLGISEEELAMELVMNLLRLGSDIELPFHPIVSFGENTANPHAVPSAKKLQRGNLLLVDWGASYHGYIADITRTFSIGKPEDEFAKIAKIVLEANLAARDVAMPGRSASELDKAARDTIESTGYGIYFTHRTGHGLGLETHEAPYIRSGNPLVLQTGMVFTVEPGIYLPGRGGVRIEDDIVISPDGNVCLTSMERELRVIDL